MAACRNFIRESSPVSHHPIQLHTRFKCFAIRFFAVVGFVPLMAHNEDLVGSAFLAFFVVFAVAYFT
jgi:hypothetical protein